jgi:hypothetical protein
LGAAFEIAGGGFGSFSNSSKAEQPAKAMHKPSQHVVL